MHAQSQDLQIRLPVEKFKLGNGLTVLLQQDNTVPLVSFNTWFKVGSKDEDDGLTGMAHLFEHMMFKGAKRYSGEKLISILKENGGSFNAFTTRDYTGYFINLPSSKLELAMDIESDRMVNLKISTEMLNSERDVVKEERRFRYDNNVVGTLFEAIFESTFQKHPYHWPTIGWWKDLDRINVKNAMEFYKKNYAPNNAVIAIVGDFDVSNVKNLLNKYYGDLPAQKIQKKAYPEEPPHNGETHSTIYKESQNEYISFTYVVPRIGSPESYSLEILAKILGQGNSSRLYKKLVYESQVATSVSAHTFGLEEVDLFQIIYSLKPEKNADKVAEMRAFANKIIDEELNFARTKLYSDKELQKAKNNILMELVDSLKTFGGRARVLLSNEILVGSYEKVFSDIEVYRKVRATDIKDVASKYLNPYQKTTLMLLPNREKK